MVKIESGYLLEMNQRYYGKDEETTFCIVIPLLDELNIFEIEQYYDDNLKMCFRISDWICGISEIKENEVKKIYGLCNCGRLTDVRNRKLLWTNKESE